MKDMESLFQKALELSEKGELEKAKDTYLKCLEIEETPEIWNNLGNVYRKMEQIAKAVDCYKKAIELDRKYIPGYLNMTSALLNAERYDQAKLFAVRGLELAQNNTTLLAMLLVCHIATGNVNSATDIFLQWKEDESFLKEIKEYGLLETLKSLVEKHSQ